MSKRLIQNRKTLEIQDNEGNFFKPTSKTDLDNLDDQSEYFHNAEHHKSLCSVTAFDENDNVEIELIPDFAVEL